jgi:uncharacterized protein YegP (UPF0339 family)
MSSLSLRIRKGQSGEFRWVLLAENGEKIAWSGEPYLTKAKCMHGLGLVVNGIRAADVIDETGATPNSLGRSGKLFPRTHDGI